MFIIPPHATGQPTQAYFFNIYFSIAPYPRFSHFSSGKSWTLFPPKFFIATACMERCGTVAPAVPEAFSIITPGPGLFFISSTKALFNLFTVFLSNISGFFDPAHARAFTVLEPITAPGPDLAAALPPSLTCTPDAPPFLQRKRDHNLQISLIRENFPRSWRPPNILLMAISPL